MLTVDTKIIDVAQIQTKLEPSNHEHSNSISMKELLEEEIRSTLEFSWK